jgi:hypothetical protein
MGVFAEEDSRMTNISASNFPFLKKAFNDIIQNERDTDQTGKFSSVICQRKTFIFIDMSCLSITEFLKNGKIDFYYYDWFSRDKKLLMKFHSEVHKDETYQTDTEPYHLHVQGPLGEKRLANPFFQDLFSILQFIHCYLLVPK